MASGINLGKAITDNSQTTQSILENFAIAKAEITALQGGGASGVTTADAFILNPAGIITDTTAARTLSAGDNGRVLYFTGATPIALTMAAALGAGFACTVIQGAAGQITFAAGGQTMTIAGGLTKTASAGAMASVLAPAANVFLIAGTLA